MQKNLFLLICGLITLSSCSNSHFNIGIGGGLGGSRSGVSVGTSVSVPLNKDSSQLIQNEHIITYFDKDANSNRAGDEPFKQGYFRVLIDKKASNQWVIQDFYQENKARRSDPFIIHAKDAYLFNARPLNGGHYTLYDSDGKIIKR